MRTTLNIEDDALGAIKKYAEHRAISLGDAASALILRGIESVPQFKTENGWVIFDLPSSAPPLTNELVDEWENADHGEEFDRAFSPRR
jgi:hypothetical protein